MIVPNGYYKTRGVKMDCFFLARRPFLQLTGSPSGLQNTWNVDKGRSREPERNSAQSQAIECGNRIPRPWTKDFAFVLFRPGMRSNKKGFRKLKNVLNPH